MNDSCLEVFTFISINSDDYNITFVSIYIIREISYFQYYKQVFIFLPKNIIIFYCINRLYVFLFVINILKRIKN